MLHIVDTKPETTQHDPWPHLSRDDQLPPEAALLLPATVFGFDISQKKWSEWRALEGAFEYGCDANQLSLYSQAVS